MRSLEFDQIPLHSFPDEAGECILFEALEKPNPDGSLEDLERGPVEGAAAIWVVFESQKKSTSSGMLGAIGSHPRT